jgi:hypothetical protein
MMSGEWLELAVTGFNGSKNPVAPPVTAASAADFFARQNCLRSAALAAHSPHRTGLLGQQQRLSAKKDQPNCNVS